MTADTLTPSQALTPNPTQTHSLPARVGGEDLHAMKKVINTVLKAAGRVTIDGRDFVGRSVVINGDEVIIDGVKQDGSLSGPVSITVHGDVESIDGPSADVTVSGGAGHIKTMSGDVRCGNVSGSVSTMSGDVTCGAIGGSVSTMSGDIRTR